MTSKKMTMKANEMTDEELASFIEDVIWGEQKVGNSFIREAAKRLRRPTPVDDDLLKVARDIIDKLRAKLKVAVDALKKLQTICKNTEYVYGRVICDDALAAIREPVTDCNRLDSKGE